MFWAFCLLFKGIWVLKNSIKLLPVMSLYYNIGALQPTINSLNPARAWVFDLWTEDRNCTWLRSVTWNTDRAPSRVSGTLEKLSKYQLLFKLLLQLLFATDICSSCALKTDLLLVGRWYSLTAHHLLWLFSTNILCWTIYIFAKCLDRV